MLAGVIVGNAAVNKRRRPMDGPSLFYVWSALLTLLGCALIVLEVFIPSGGILGFLAAASVFTAIALAFYHYGRAVGFGFVAVAVVALVRSDR